MNRLSKRVLLLMVLGFCVGSFGLTNEEKQKKESKESIKIARKYLKECKNSERTVPLGGLGWDEVREYWARVPELQKLRDDFEKAGAELKEVMIEEDEEYAELRKRMEGPERAEAIKEYNSKKSSIFRRLDRSSSAYRRAREKREEALYTSNIETLEYIIDDYEEKGWVIPTEWMQKGCGHHH